jgi:hypothetical protein
MGKEQGKKCKEAIATKCGTLLQHLHTVLAYHSVKYTNKILVTNFAIFL